MRDYKEETARRVEFIRAVLEDAKASGIVFGNSGGKDCALAGILCKKACENTLSLLLPCGVRRNYDEDARDARALADMFGIESRTVDIVSVKAALSALLGEVTAITAAASANITPRLRMTALYACAASENRLVCGTGNKSERYVGYFTKWGDGAYDFNPIADLTASEVLEFLRFLGAPEAILAKAPSAALTEGQTDEAEMGISYADLDRFLLTGQAAPNVRARAEALHRASAHKRRGVPMYGE
ncbi:MAG: NAD(+) synthase [Oscillospiraceae bacterium]|jgi:NAD+ synthase|nr:NAD(+) synthase [Oscillospiraceae bacterium]